MPLWPCGLKFLLVDGKKCYESSSCLILRAKQGGYTSLQVGDVEEVDGLASLLGCKVGRFPTYHLNFPLGAPHKSSIVWDVVEERHNRRLASWKK
ncbi:hypothetical protein AAG906_021621 [Vitis piasezkii]